ncbi:N-acetylglucosamine kinase [Dyadobacter arcticus]|uniref:N-acetylglucosamine kinase-like BadF-type ATPase n=1 Tax=Dyadobacter arcticus TaxID=1078754 RepID=A0ABX0UET1_9BACT|nr:N-acetylglucosamine kinase [Dyadobacter arcticus]NIJ51172.1 N-acetylglucosamine kinase-like BadF-type ATPase [Dyadobacter arcticus]
MLSKLTLLADSGSTKTDWIVINSDAQVNTFQSAGINPFYQTAEEIIPVIESQVIPHIQGDITKIHFFGAGCADEKSSKPVFDALKETIRSAGLIEVASDMLGAAKGLCGRSPGLACILGTGANNAFYDGEKIIKSIGSLGFWLGDEGSGSYLGKTLVVQFLQNDLPADLHDSFAKIYPEVNRLSVLDHAYKKPYPNRYFAAFSTFIAANRQHDYIQNLISEAFGLFVQKYILKHPDAGKYPVHFTGSIAYHYKDLLIAGLTKYGLQSGRILKSPLEGLVQYYS